MMFLSVNWMAILLGAFIGMLFGMAWYSEILFAKKWRRLMKLDRNSKNVLKIRGKMLSYGIHFFALLILGFAIAQIVNFAKIVTPFSGFKLAILLWFGLVATTQIGSVIWEGKSIKLFLINGIHSFGYVLIMTIILSVW